MDTRDTGTAGGKGGEKGGEKTPAKPLPTDGKRSAEEAAGPGKGSASPPESVKSDPAPRPVESAAASASARASDSDPKPQPAPDASPSDEQEDAEPDTAGFYDAVLTAYRDLCAKLEAVWCPADLHQSAAEAQHAMQQKLAGLGGPGQELEQCEAMVDYLRAVRRLHAPERQRAQIDFAFRRYLEEMRAIWTRDDLTEMPPGLIVEMGESIAWAAHYADQRPQG